MTTNPYIGSSLDDLLKEDGVLEEVEAIAIKRVLAWQVSQPEARERTNQNSNGSKDAHTAEFSNLHYLQYI
jgi:hypothetical protein